MVVVAIVAVDVGVVDRERNLRSKGWLFTRGMKKMSQERLLSCIMLCFCRNLFLWGHQAFVDEPAPEKRDEDCPEAWVHWCPYFYEWRMMGLIRGWCIAFWDQLDRAKTGCSHPKEIGINNRSAYFKTPSLVFLNHDIAQTYPGNYPCNSAAYVWKPSNTVIIANLFGLVGRDSMASSLLAWSNWHSSRALFGFVRYDENSVLIQRKLRHLTGSTLTHNWLSTRHTVIHHAIPHLSLVYSPSSYF